MAEAKVEAKPEEKEEQVEIFNQSQRGKVFTLRDGTRLNPNEVVSVGKKEADFLLGVGPKGVKYFPELRNAREITTSKKAQQELKDALAENERLTKENADLKDQLQKLKPAAALAGDQSAKGGKK